MNTQEWNAGRYAENARFVSDLGQPVLELLAPRVGERILDLGCGDGALTEKLMAAGAHVVGADSSVSMVEAARRRGIDAHVVDATALTYRNEFDAVFTNAVLHWIKKDPDAPIAGAFAALKAGGRFVGEFGGHGCVAAISVALIATLERRGIKNAAALYPWYFPTVDDYRTRLEKAGFVCDSVELIARPTRLPGTLKSWLETFAAPLTAVLPAADQAGFLEEVRTLLAPVLCDKQGRWTADYTRLRFAAHKPEGGGRP